MSLPVKTTPEVDNQIRAIDDWWRRNRQAAPDLFLDEVTGAFDRLSRAPMIGRSYRRSPVPHTRRVLLEGSHYHVYYAVADDEVWVLSGTRVEALGRHCASRRLLSRRLEPFRVAHSCGAPCSRREDRRDRER